MADLIDDVKKRLKHIKEQMAARAQEECIDYLDSRIYDFQEEIDVFVPTANDTEQLNLLKKLRKEYKTNLSKECP